MSRSRPVSGSIPSLTQGVSQQPQALRLPAQAQSEVNAYPDVAGGLLRRPGVQHVAHLSATPLGQSFTHFIKRDATESYILVATDGDLKVYDLEGDEKTVAFPDGKGYLSLPSGVTPSASFAALTVLDTTFFCNRTVAPALTSKQAPSNVNEAIVWFREGAYGSKYQIIVDGDTSTRNTPDGSSANHANEIATTEIAADLKGKVENNGPALDVTRKGSVLRIRRNDLGPFDIDIETDLGGRAMTLITTSVQTFTDLPAECFDGFTVKVEGESSNADDDYYVRYDNGARVWVETPEPDRLVEIDPATMPYRLNRLADGTFEFVQAAWAECTAGDQNTCPDPLFIGKKLNDMVFYADRLTFLADEAAIFSESGDYFNFWRKSARDLLDDDRVQLTSNSRQVSILRRAVTWNKHLAIFSDETQFIVPYNENGFSSVTGQIVSLTSYQAEGDVAPVVAGKDALFATTQGGWTSIRALKPSATLASNTEDPPNLTAHCPRFVNTGVFKLEASTNEQALFVLSEETPNKVFLYRWFDLNDQRVQAAWSEWVFDEGSTIRSVETIREKVYFLVDRADGAFLECVDLSENRDGNLLNLRPHLDRRILAGVSELGLDGDGNTIITLPYDEDGDLKVISSGGAEPLGYIYEATREGQPANHVKIPGRDLLGEELWVGKLYTTSHEFSQFFVRKATRGGGLEALSSGRLQLSYLNVTFADSTYFRVESTPKFRQTYVRPFTGKVVGEGNTIIGAMNRASGVLRVPIVSEAEGLKVALINDSAFPSTWLSAEWVGRWNPKSTRIT